MPFSFFHLLTVTGVPCIHAVVPVSGTPENYADVLLARLQEMVVARQVAALKSRVQRINPIEQADEHGRLWGELVALEMHRIRLRERAIGGL